MILTLQPVGSVDPSILERLRSELASLGDVWIATSKPVPRQAYRRLTRQYRAAAFEAVCRATDGDRIVAITNVELCDPELGMRRVFGHANLQGRWAVVSLALFGGDGEDRLVERAVKTSIHEIGHTLGLAHHDADPTCVMYFSERLADTDRKGRAFCPDCARAAGLTENRPGM
jgi:archaemetzincin